MSSIDGNDIRAFRARNSVEPINNIEDLDQKSSNVTNIFDQVKEMEKKGFDMLNKVPDNGATCSIQVKYYITTIIQQAKEQCDYCVERNVNKENPLNLNVSCPFYAAF